MKNNHWKLQRFNVVEVALALAVITITVTALCAWIPLGSNALKGIRNESQIEACVGMVNAYMKESVLTGKIKAAQPHTQTEGIVKWKTEDLWRIFAPSKAQNWQSIVIDTDGNVRLSKKESPKTGGKVFRFNSFTSMLLDGKKSTTLDFSAEVWTTISAMELKARYQIPIVISWPASLPPERRSYRFLTNYMFCPNTELIEK